MFLPSLRKRFPYLIVLAAVAMMGALSACGEEEPLRIGFIGGLTGRNSDLGVSSRNAVQMAVEQKNEAGGINGRRIELLIRDDANSPNFAETAVTEMIESGAVAIIGPNISAIATTVIPVANARKVPLISPTVASTVFSGKNDYFFRVSWTTRDNALAYAAHYFEKGYRRIAVAYDLANRVFSESWLEFFREYFEELGGRIAAAVPFDAEGTEGYSGIVRQMLDADPDSLLFVAGGVNTAQLAQQVRKEDRRIPMIAAEWAATESLIELGGRAVEGLEMGQVFDRSGNSPEYTEFKNAYRASFHLEPGYASVAAYDAATVLLTALERNIPGESLRDTLAEMKPIQGLQQQLAFDAYGDGSRRAFFIVVRKGRFESQ